MRNGRRLIYGTSGRASQNNDPAAAPVTNAQYIDVFLPSPTMTNNTTTNGNRRRGMVFFVHGGAWGSGQPWFYRLVASPFLRLGLAVAIVGYRVYPLSSTVQEQVDDLQMAFETLQETYPEWCSTASTIPDRHDENNNMNMLQTNDQHFGTIVMGHSSGAHIALLWIVDRIKKKLKQQQQQQKNQCSNTQSGVAITTFVGISGPYNIDHHFDYEAARGVEEISPLKAANGYTRTEFLRNSPIWRLQDALKGKNEVSLLRNNDGSGGNDSQNDDSCCIACLQDFFPPHSLLIHGMEDDTVPFTATSEAARGLRACGVTGCDECYVPQTGHQDAVVHLMLGGRVQNSIVKWLLRTNKSKTNGILKESSTSLLRSKL
jgi:pimeloyl-ACP methyl ester carboxylesterase